ncbi:MAG: FKBP-type peptidyl-prolyl cis-trans isomerase [Cyclobacteriaceae bacterium]
MKNLNWKLWGLAFVIMACSSENTIKTESGVEVTYIEEGEGITPNHGEVMLINMYYNDDTGKDLYNTDSVGGAVPIRFDTANWKEAGMLYEVISLLREGDSIHFNLPILDLFTKSFGQPVPDSLADAKQVSFRVGLEDVMTFEAFMDFRLSKQTSIDGEIIDEYLEENDIDAVTTDTGLRYAVTQEGTGAKPEVGQTVIVHYHGTLMDGTKFDSSYDRGDPFTFPLGQGRVIRGWDEGIALLNVGSKATLYIPSALGYGERGSGGVIPPNAVLKFDVELVGIEEN